MKYAEKNMLKNFEIIRRIKMKVMAPLEIPDSRRIRFIEGSSISKYSAKFMKVRIITRILILILDWPLSLFLMLINLLRESLIGEYLIFKNSFGLNMKKFYFIFLFLNSYFYLIIIKYK